MTWLITVKGDDTFVWDGQITGTESEMLAKLPLLLHNLGSSTIEQFRSITIDKID
jgi:hypothetical protein